jgi:hypothetical protein
MNRNYISLHFPQLREPGTRIYITLLYFNIKFKVILRLTVSRPVYLDIGHLSGAHDQILVTVEHLRLGT